MSRLIRNLSNLPGWKTDSKFIIFESDDWGSIRMPSPSAFNRLEESGVDLRSADAERYNLNDTLETKDDLAALFEVLDSVKGGYNCKAVFTPVCIVANPDFERIEKSGFSEYYYEPFTDTFKRYEGCEDSFALWTEGMSNGLFMPQMHGREHLNVIAWMSDLKRGEKNAHLAFRERLTGIVPAQYPRVDYQAAFLLEDPSEMKFHKKVIVEGLELFEKIFGYRAEYFVPPNGPFNNKLNYVLAESGIKYRYASRIQHETIGQEKFKRVFHWMGQRSASGLRYIIRNCFFEPSQSDKDWVDSCLYDIKTAFNWKKPAVISTHRVNYIGALNPANRDKGLKQLESLLKSIVHNWPEVQFLTTPQIGALMNNLKSNGQFS